jgi:hypothetical protein
MSYSEKKFQVGDVVVYLKQNIHINRYDIMEIVDIRYYEADFVDVKVRRNNAKHLVMIDHIIPLADFRRNKIKNVFE